MDLRPSVVRFQGQLCSSKGETRHLAAQQVRHSTNSPDPISHNDIELTLVVRSDIRLYGVGLKYVEARLRQPKAGEEVQNYLTRSTAESSLPVS